MKKSADIYLNVLLTVTTAVLFLTLAFTLVTGESPYEAAGIDPSLGVIVTLGLVMLLFAVPYLLNQDFRISGFSARRWRRRAKF